MRFTLISAALRKIYLRSELAAEDYCDDLVDGGGRSVYFDKVGSVSALVEVEVDTAYDPTHIELNERLEFGDQLSFL